MKYTPAIALAILAVVSLTAAPVEADDAATCALNTMRNGASRSNIAEHSGLKTAAGIYCRLMSSLRQLSHSLGLDIGSRFEQIGRQYGLHAVTENIAKGHTSIPDVMAGWRASPGHYNNILGAHTHYGLASSTGSDGERYWALLLANDGKQHSFPACPSESSPAPAPEPAPVPAPAPAVPAPEPVPATPVVPEPTPEPTQEYTPEPTTTTVVEYTSVPAPTETTKPRKCHKRKCTIGHSKCVDGKLFVCRHGHWKLSECPASKKCKVDSPLKACCA